MANAILLLSIAVVGVFAPLVSADGFDTQDAKQWDESQPTSPVLAPDTTREPNPRDLFGDDIATLLTDLEAGRLVESSGQEIVNARGKLNVTPLIWLTSKGNVEPVSTLIGLKADVNAATESGITALMVAARQGHRNVLVELLAAGAKVNVQDQRGNTALIYAAWNGQVDVIQKLMGSGADAMIVNKSRQNARQVALARGHTEAHATIVRLMAQVKPDDVFQEPSMVEVATAISAGGGQSMIASLPEDQVSKVGRGGVSLLHWSIRSKNLGAFGALLKRGADPNQSTESGFTPVFVAAGMKEDGFLRQALAHGGKADSTGPKESTALLAAIAARRATNVKQLIDAGAQPNLRGGRGILPLNRAVFYGDAQMVKLLIDAGADPSKEDGFGIDALTVASSLNRTEIQKILVAAVKNDR